MEASSENLIAAAGDVWQTLTALIVAYAFSALGAILILIIGWIIAGLAERWSYSGLGAFKHIDETIKRFISKTLRYMILVLVGITVLSQFGVQTTSIIAALGAAGLAIGLALQGTLQNIAAGLMLLFLRPFRVGEYVDAGDVAGTIKEIGLFATELRTFDGLYVMAPNSSLWGKPIKNFSRNTTRRADIAVGIGYNDNVELGRSLLLDMMKQEPRVFDDPAPMVFVTELADNSVNLGLRYWSQSSDYEVLKSDMTNRAKSELEAHGLSIPFPQRDVHHFYEAGLPPREAAAGSDIN
ncbi:mechanosensitive ion channel [Tianweitania sp. BSSL-BM11]|uniref:Small-conductance mechanosensitive channel n=1 Tax=Tianweitania aestuarii TaxID=2814886 RepID=A0ABS5RSB4_9HYPH|nr:mechanosensitive ion channel domain-containing protein [Tianweitania aestuarii]MBS9719948.1 mechanosensitive ion channel [Tianweitania aestuarii]